MNIQRIVSGSTLEFLVSGRVDGEGANQLEEQMIQAVRTDVQTILVNLNQATFLCSAGLRVLMQYWRQMKGRQKVLQVTRPSPEVDAVLAATGFRDAFVEKI